MRGPSANERSGTSGVSPALVGLTLVHRIGLEIVSGEFQPDIRLPDEATMLSRYEISRTTLREAYSKLTAKGLITARPKVGTVVRPKSDWNMLDADVLTWHLETRAPEEIARDLYVLRRMIEPEASALAAQHRTGNDLAVMGEAYADMRASTNHETGLVDADMRFHLGILSATHNYFIGAFSSLIHAAMISTFKLSWRGAESILIKEDRLLQHRDVLEAISQNKPEAARTLMERLLDDSINDVSDSHT